MTPYTILPETVFKQANITIPIGTVITCKKGGLVMRSGITETTRLVTKAEFCGVCWKAIEAIDLPEGFLEPCGDECGDED